MDAIAVVADRLRRAGRITALTGAGVSAASGIPTFRGPDGLWKKVRAETLATPEAFENDPKLVWEWYDWRRGMITSARPNAAHEVLARWTRERPDFTLITQNVDGLHETARAPNGCCDLHGSIWHVRCWNALRGGTHGLARRHRAAAPPAADVSALRRPRPARRRLVRRIARPRRHRRRCRRGREPAMSS